MIPKKAQGMSMRVVIVAVIAMIVLVSILAIFSGKIGFFSRNIDVCKERGGECAKDSDACKFEEGKTSLYNAKGFSDCGKEDKYCCIPVIKSEK